MPRLSKETWEQVKVAYASGIGLRELARNMKVPAGTVLARAKREGWTQAIAAAKIASQPQLAKDIVKADAINAITPLQSIAAVMQERGELHRDRMASVSEKVVDHLETMHPNEILNRSAQVEKIDTVARRTFGLDTPAAGSCAVQVNVLCGGRAIVGVRQNNK